MAEYVEKAALLKKLDNVIEYFRKRDGIAAVNDAAAGLLEQAKKLVEETPGEELEPVVRCRECGYYDEVEGGLGGMEPYCRMWGEGTEEDGFCSCGERGETNGGA